MKRATLKDLAAERYDLLVIGGGITGSGVAREAALRGLRVALVEAADFAHGTSSRSTKLIHGGLRYLKNMDFRLVREAVQERMRMLKMAPHLVTVLPFFFPVYRGDSDPLWMLRIGLTMYDWYAGKGNPIPHQVYNPQRLWELERSLSRDGLVGGAVYCDARTDDARLTLEVVQSAASHGASIANYTEVDRFLYGADRRISGANLTDRLTGESGEVRAAVVLAAGGPWADRIRRLDDPSAPPLLRLTKGVHFTLPAAKLPIKNAVVMRGHDGRMMFAVPSGAFTYVGTTDTDYEGDPLGVRVERSDIEYILEATNRTFPDCHAGTDDVTSAWAGLRPLVRPAGDRSPSATSRDYMLSRAGSGLISVAGGKLTAFRHMAAHIVDELFPTTRSPRHLEHSESPLPGALRPSMGADRVADLAARTGAPVAGVARLAERYGGLFEQVVTELPPFNGSTGTSEQRWLSAQLRYAVHDEMAMRLEDVLARRTEALLFSVGNGAAYVGSLAAEMGEMLGWSEQRVQEEAAGCQRLIADMFAWKRSAER